jgi:methylmalonyl-CoA mutase N-terminal domain/subunit
VTIALRTQQIIAEESGVTHTIDPLGGSYYVEWLTNEIERQALDYIEKIDEMGGMVDAVERGYPQREIAAAAYRLQRQIDDQEKIVVGVNSYTQGGENDRIPLLRVDEQVQRDQVAALAAVKAGRSQTEVEKTLDGVRQAAKGDENLMPKMIAAARAYATEQEICDVLREVFGQHQDRPEF